MTDKVDTGGNPKDIELAERVSALADGEMAGPEIDTTLDALLHDEAARARLTTYQAIGATLRRSNDAALLTQSIAGRVMAAIDAEGDRAPDTALDADNVVPLRARASAAIAEERTDSHPESSPESSPDTSLEKRRMGQPFAIAASILVAGVLGFILAREVPQGGTPAPNEPERTAVGSPQPAPISSIAEATAPVMGWDVEDASVQQRLQGYLVSHSEYLGRGMRGMHPYARVVAAAGGQR